MHNLVVMFFPFSTGTADEVSSESDDEDFHIKVPPPLPQSDTGTTESSSSDTNKGTLSYFSNNTCRHVFPCDLYSMPVPLTALSFRVLTCK